MRENLRNVPVILLLPVSVPHASLPVDRELEMQRSGRKSAVTVRSFCLVSALRSCRSVRQKRGKLPAEFTIPRFRSPVSAHYPEPVESLQVILRDAQFHTDLYIREIFPKVLFPDNIISAHGAHGVKDGSLSGIILSYQYKRIFNITDMHILN